MAVGAPSRSRVRYPTQVKKRRDHQPAISVLLPVRDAEATLEAALRSLARQSFADFQAVCVNDGSVDSSGEILDRWAATDPRFEVVHIARCGLVPTLNAGLALCRGPMVARMDGDDVCHPRRFELQHELFDDQPDLGVVSCLVRHFPQRGVGEGNRLYEEWLNGLVDHSQILRERFVEAPVAHPSAMVRREILETAGGYRDRGWPEDYDLWLRLLHAGVRFAKVRRHLLFWREHERRLTRVQRCYSKDAFLRCKAHHLLRGPLAKGTPAVLWGAGPTGRRLSGYLLEGGAAIEAVVDIDPAKVGDTMRGLPIIAPETLSAHLTPETVVLTAVAARGGRALVRARLESMGLEEGARFFCVA